MLNKLLIDDYPLVLLPKLGQAVGVNEAIVLQQIHYWLRTFERIGNKDHFHEGKWWVRNTYAEWKKSNFPFWSERTIMRLCNKLEKLGLIISSEFNGDRFNHTKWYTINYDAVNSLEITEPNDSDDDADSDSDKLSPSDSDKLSPSLYTETTTETKTPPIPPSVNNKPPIPVPQNEGGDEKPKTTTELVALTWFGIESLDNLTRMEKANIETLMDEIDGIKKGMTPQDLKAFVAWYKIKHPKLNLPGEKAIAKYLRLWMQSKQPAKSAPKKKTCGKCDQFGMIAVEDENGRLYAKQCDCQKAVKRAS